MANANETYYEKRSEYINEYNKNNYDRIYLSVPKGDKAKYQKKAQALGMSLREWLITLMENA